MRSVHADCMTRSSSSISVDGGAFIDRRSCSTLARVCGAASTCARIAAIASAQATSAVPSMTKVWVSSENAPDQEDDAEEEVEDADPRPRHGVAEYKPREGEAEQRRRDRRQVEHVAP